MWVIVSIYQLVLFPETAGSCRSDDVLYPPEKQRPKSNSSENSGHHVPLTFIDDLSSFLLLGQEPRNATARLRCQSNVPRISDQVSEAWCSLF